MATHRQDGHKKKKSTRRLRLETLIPALRKADGNMSQVARMFGVYRQAVHNYVHSHPEALAAWHESRESMKDVAESMLYKKVKAGETAELLFFLKTQAKDRGYVERQEQTGKDGQPQESVIRVVYEERKPVETEE